MRRARAPGRGRRPAAPGRRRARAAPLGIAACCAPYIHLSQAASAIRARGGGTPPPIAAACAAAGMARDTSRMLLLLLLYVSTASSSGPGSSSEGLLAAAAPPSATFGTPVLIGTSNISASGGSHFWFPSLSIATGIRGHVAQHITLSGDGGLCPLPGKEQACDQIMLTKDGGRSYELVKKVTKPSYSPAAYVPTSGNFNGYGDLGTWVPPQRGSKPVPGVFRSIVGCNDCLGGSMRYPTYMQTWADLGDSLRLTANVTIKYTGTPPAFLANKGCPGSYAPPPAPPGNQKCGLRTPSQSIIRMSNGELLMVFYGHAADGAKLCGSDGKSLCLTTAFYTSADGPSLH
jgi:hypothetical protein